MLFVIELVLGKGCVEGGQPFVDLAGLGLVRLRELGAVLDEVDVVDLDQALLLRRQLRHFGAVVHRRDPLEELGVVGDVVGEDADLRRIFLVDLLEIRRVQIAGKDAVDRHDAVQRLARPLHRHNGVLERRRRRVVGDRFGFSAGFGDGGVEGGREVGDLHLVEGRQAAVGAGPRRGQRINRGGRRGVRGRHGDQN